MMTIETIRGTEKLIEHLKKRFQDKDLDVIRQACAFAEANYAQINHPVGLSYNEYIVEVAIILDDLRFDYKVISAAVLYPPPIVNEKVFDEIRNRFNYVNGLIEIIEDMRHLYRFKLNPWAMLNEQSDFKERKEILLKTFRLTIDENSEDQEQRMAAFFQSKEKQTDNLIRMFIGLVTDIHALIIQLADCLYFIKILKGLSPSQQEALSYRLFANLGIALYAPMADRLGIWKLKSGLEDMSFRLLEPDKYTSIKNQLAAKKQEREDYIAHVVIPGLSTMLNKFDITATISGRAKHIYGIYQKMKAKQLDFEHLNDLLGIRIIVDTIKDCYTALDVILTFWPPVKEFYGGEDCRDWVENPKANQYQSLHTTIDFDYKKVEIQIRTRKMDEIAEYGIATQHWLYKSSKTYRKGRTPTVNKLKDQNWSKKLESLRRNLANEQESVESKGENLINKQKPSESGREGSIKDRIFVLTPKGHIIDLRIGSTPLDFAYRIHTDLGHKYRGVKVNGHLEHLDYKLNMGDIVELLPTRPRKAPSPDWLSRKQDEEGNNYYVYAQTPQTRSKIRSELNKQKQ